ncbi:MAG TPA: AMP-binding protein [Pirellulales bacterium]|jgi:fatty-acyl-CoA synthase|nr:AMP-binding protein [Pirellulales bacterium]
MPVHATHHRPTIDEQATPWVEGLTIGQVLARTAERHGELAAAIFPASGYQATWRQFLADVDRVARGLLALGVRKGEHVAVWATNVPEWVQLQFATARIGAVMVTINPAYRSHELKYVLRQSDAVTLVLVDQFKKSDYFAMLAEACPQLAAGAPGALRLDEFPRLRSIVAIRGTPPAGAMAWSDFLAGGDRQAVDLEALGRTLAPREPINIQYTSGTTGFPKAATLSHRNLLLNAFYVGMCQKLSAADRICIPVPFYHCFGCVLGTLNSIIYGATMIIPADSFNPTATLEAIERHRATVLYGVPTMFIAQLQDSSFDSRDLSSLRTGIMSGSPCPIEVMRQVVARMNAREITIAYGQTEASPVITQTRADDPIELRVETVGRPLPGVEVKLVDPATGLAVGDNVQGELCARGHVVMLGYYNNPEATAAAIDRDGWLHTGDLAKRRPDGYYHITGRIKDLVIRGGENIYPREIEEYLFTHSSVEQASVVGVPDPKFGEELCAWIKLKAGAACTEEELRAFCRANLAHYKVPRYVRFVEAFPQTVTGKIQKFKIREQMIADLGLDVPKTA